MKKLILLLASIMLLCSCTVAGSKTSNTSGEKTNQDHIYLPVDEYLPIGSIVNVKKTDKKLMIFGIIQSDQTVQNGKEFDYIAVPYPEGNMGLDYQYLINADDIDSVVFRGYEDKEREEFLERLNTELEKYRDEGSSN